MVLLFALVVLGTPVKRDAQTIYSDIDNIVAKVQALDNSIKALPSSPTYVEALVSALVSLSWVIAAPEF